MFGSPFYHSHIRNTIVAFGNLFSNIKIARMNRNTDTIVQTLHVPIAYSQKEKWIQQIDQNPKDTNGVYATIPRLGFEILGYNYDSERKLGRMNKLTCPTDTGRNVLYTPVPYNLDISLYFVTKNQEDALQILEQILPTFTPEYTISIQAIPELGINQDIPFILNSVDVQDDYEGDFETRRFVIHTLSFTAKLNLFGGISEKGVITDVEANIGDNPQAQYTASQETPESEIIENWLEDF